MKKKKSVLFVLTYYRPHWTGLTKYASRLAEALVEKKWKVGVICVRHNKDLKKEERVMGVRVKRIDYVCRLSRSFLTPSYIFRVWREMENYETLIAYLPL